MACVSSTPMGYIIKGRTVLISSKDGDGFTMLFPTCEGKSYKGFFTPQIGLGLIKAHGFWSSSLGENPISLSWP